MRHHTRLFPRLCALLLLAGVILPARAEIVRQPLTGAAASGLELLREPGFEADAQPAAWTGWDNGFARAAGAGRGGGACAEIGSDDRERQYGASQTVRLDQRRATPLVATAWSRAEGVEGGRDTGYSLYLDITYTDGDHLWGQAAGFRTGTHDWERQRVLVMPAKPIETVTLHLLFRGHTGRVWFDDASLQELDTAGGGVFDGVPVAAPEPTPAAIGEAAWSAEAGAGLRVALDADGALLGASGAERGGLYVRDVAAEGPFERFDGTLAAEADGSARFEGEAAGLRATMRLEAGAESVRIEGAVLDTTGRDRAVTVYLALPVDARGWTWWDDAETPRRIEQTGTYLNPTSYGVGNTGQASRYPLACVSGPERGVAIAAPLDRPSVCRLAYDAATRELYAAFDLALVPETKQPSAASFALVAYGFDPAWGFRAALQRYYDLFPDLFTKRTTHEGIWMPFTDIATVEGAEDFGFAFHEGDNNPAWDDAHDILTFVYVEPMTCWLALPPEAPRTYEAAVARMEELARGGDRGAQAVLSSGAQDESGRWDVDVVDAPWCDGAVFTVEADPDIRAPEGGLSQFEERWATIRASLDRVPARFVPGWTLDPGAAVVPEEGVGHVVEAVRRPGEAGILIRQAVPLHQTEPRDLVARATSSCEEVTGEADSDYSLYLDLQYADGTNLFGQVARFEPGSHGWQEAEVRIHPEKPLASAALHLILRGAHTGTARFHGVFLGEVGSDRNLVTNPEFAGETDAVGVVDGAYIDSYEGWATRRDYRRDHFAAADVPLTFTADTREPVLLTGFSTYEFGREVSERMHREGRLLMANATPWSFPWGAHTLDVMGTETNWCPQGQYQPDPHEVFRYRRALCRQKPYVLLQNTVYDDFTPQMVERYMKRSVFYAVYPSFFSHNAADDPYWQRPALYNRDRALFLRYIPLCRTLSAAGWQPVPHARTESPGFLLERYGDGAGPTYLAAFHSGPEAATGVVTLDAGKLGLAVPCTARELLSGAEVAIDERGVARLELGAEDLAVLELPPG